MSDLTSSPLADFDAVPENATKYEILGVSSDADADDLRRNYRQLALKYHPDRYRREIDKARAEEIFKKVAAAYEVLKDPQKRGKYDDMLHRGVAEQQPDEDVEVTPLDAILREIFSYEHVFTDIGLNSLRKELREAVREAVSFDDREHIVDVVRMQKAPDVERYSGFFKGGSLVLTNFRILAPFSSEWTTTSGNTKTHHTKLYMPSVMLPGIEEVVISDRSRIMDLVNIELRSSQRVARLWPVKTDLSRFLLMFALWGIPFRTTESTRPLIDLFSLPFNLLRPLIQSQMAGCIWPAVFLTAVYSIVNEVTLVVTLLPSLLGCVLGFGLYRTIWSYWGATIRDVMREDE